MILQKTKVLLSFIMASALLTSCSSAVSDTVSDTSAISEETEITETVYETEISVEETEALEETAESTEETETSSSSQKVLVSFIGDCTLAEDTDRAGSADCFTNVINGDYNYCFQNAVEYLSQDDMTLANFEGTLTTATQRQDKEFTFAGDPEFVQILLNGSVEAVNLANNHTYDFYEQGVTDTENTLDENGIVWSNDQQVGIYNVGDVVIGMAGSSFDTSLDTMYQRIDELRSMGANIIIISCHWGIEKDYEPRADQVSYGHALIDYGADIVVGTHPHRLQPIEEYNGKYILYSLSNFVFGGNTYLSDPDSAIIQCEFTMDETGTYCVDYTLNVIPFSQTTGAGNDYCPRPYEWGSDDYYRVMSRLGWSQEDE